MTAALIADLPPRCLGVRAVRAGGYEVALYVGQERNTDAVVTWRLFAPIPGTAHHTRGVVVARARKRAAEMGLEYIRGVAHGAPVGAEGELKKRGPRPKAVPA